MRAQQVELVDEPDEAARVVAVDDRQHAMAARDHPVGRIAQRLVGQRDDRGAFASSAAVAAS